MEEEKNKDLQTGKGSNIRDNKTSTPRNPSLTPWPDLGKGEGFLGVEKEKAESDNLQPNNDKIENSAILHTFHSDASDFVKSRGITSADVLAAETKQGRNIGNSYDSHDVSEIGKKQKNNVPFIVFSAIALIVILGGIVAYLAFRPKESQLEIIIRETKPFVIPDRVIESSLDNLFDVVGINGQVNTLLYIPVMKTEGLEKKHITSQEFLGSLIPRAPESVTEGLETSFMLSEFHFSNNTPVLIFKVGSPSRATSGMISWEKSIGTSLGRFFGTVSGETFKDLVIEGYDARGVIGSNGKPKFFYSFIEKGSYLIITKSEEGFAEIIRRFNYPQYRNI